VSFAAITLCVASQRMFIVVISLSTHSGNFWIHPRLSFPGGEADHSPPSSAEVKDAWSYTSTPPIPLHGMVLN
jgi:hypothetical protein